MRRFFVLVPSLSPAGPVKGAVALANAIAAVRDVTLVSLKDGPGVGAPIQDAVRVLSLAHVRKWRRRVSAYSTLLRDAGGRNVVASISMCLSADITNLFCRANAVTCSSVRGNLLRNYRLDYGLAGAPLAVAHLCALRAVDHVVAMNSAMASQVHSYVRRTPAIIGNFIDEPTVEPYRKADKPRGPLRLVFVASLTARKCPELLIDAIRELVGQGIAMHLDMLGDGPLRAQIEARIAQYGLTEFVTMRGQIADPYTFIARADVFVLPSLSEGVSRAALEALYLGVPCVLRDVDGNADLLSNSDSGTVFRRDADLAETILQVASQERLRSGVRTSLLPSVCSQAAAVQQYLDLLEQ